MEARDKASNRSFGSRGEDFAAACLARSGFEILARNFRFGRLGEIDMIARENEYICFIEVKTRSSRSFGSPAEAVDYRKQMRIKKLAMVYLKQHHLLDRFIRFDIAEVSCGRAEPGNGPAAPVSVNVIRNAF